MDTSYNTGGLSVGQLVGLSVMIMNPAKTAEPMKMSFGVSTRVGARKLALDVDAHRRNLPNTTEPSMCGGDAAFLSVTLTTCDYLLLSVVIGC